MLSLIQSRRAANGLPAYDGPTDESSLLIELMEQRRREFFLEGKRMGDSRRNPSAVQHLPLPGSPYHKAGFGVVGSQTCWTLPTRETSNR